MRKFQVIIALLIVSSFSTGLLSVAFATEKASLALKNNSTEIQSATEQPLFRLQPLHHPSPFYYKELVELTSLDESFVIDQRYATKNNFTGKIHYDTVLCLIHKDIARRLLAAQRLARSKGLRIKVFDAYRPVSVQQSLYDATPKELRMYVAKPSANSLHPKGLAVDITLVDSTGRELDMPSKFDDFSVKAHIDYEGATDRQKSNRSLLIDIMERSGFRVNKTEWWHYYVPESAAYPLLDVHFIHFLRARSGRLDYRYSDISEYSPSEDLSFRIPVLE
ncbi:MAG: M15 family metallopeptidase [Youngiibacter sp.]|nr:M15 family metallopeptidase [Youngiibacter sp.]